MKNVFSVGAVAHQVSRWKAVARDKVVANGSFKGSNRETVSVEQRWDELSAATNQPAHRSEKLRKACASGLYARAQLLLNQGASVHTRDEAFDRTPMHYASIGGHVNIVRLLLHRNADPNASDLACQTPLMLAAERGNTNVIEELVHEGGAHVWARSSSGNVALHHCACNNHVDATRVLFQLMGNDFVATNAGTLKEFDAALSNNWGETPLDLARARGHEALVKVLQRQAWGPEGASKAVPPRSEVSSSASEHPPLPRPHAILQQVGRPAQKAKSRVKPKRSQAGVRGR